MNNAASGSPGTGDAANAAGSNGGSAPVFVGEAAKPSQGCNIPSVSEPGKFNSSTVGDRKIWLRLPTGYDAARAYPVIFIWKGCNTPGLTSYNMENWAGKDACQRGDVLRGIGTIAGAYKPAFMKGAPACIGNGLSAFMVSDLSYMNNPFYDTDNDGDSVEVAVDHWLNANGCTEKAWSLDAGTPAKPDESVCRAYSNCGKNPVELCLTTGKGHDAQQDLSMPGFWQMFQQSLPH